MISVIILAIVFILIAVRRIGNVSLKIWQIMLLGAIAALLTRQISIINALKAINLDIMLFLFGMFVVGVALEESGYLSHLSYKAFRSAKSLNKLILLVIFGTGIASAFLMNDTLAIIGTPVMLLLAKKHNTSSKMMLLALAFAVTIGSVMSPIGNPQNLLIAINGNIRNPFVAFLRHLFLPTMINLLIAYLLLKLFYKPHFHEKPLDHSQEPILDKRLALISKISLCLIAVMIIAKIAFVVAGINADFRLSYIALIAAFPVLAFGRKRIEMLKKVDWQTLVFFAAMFILMQSVWDSGFFQGIIEGMKLNITSMPMILSVSILLSQLISNVPLVALYLPLLSHAGASAISMVALAAGSTIAGNLFILGAASNVIIIQNAEKKAGETITFWEFARIGIPLTILNTAVYWLFLAYV